MVGNLGEQQSPSWSETRSFASHPRTLDKAQKHFCCSNLEDITGGWWVEARDVLNTLLYVTKNYPAKGSVVSKLSNPMQKAIKSVKFHFCLFHNKISKLGNGSAHTTSQTRSLMHRELWSLIGQVSSQTLFSVQTRLPSVLVLKLHCLGNSLSLFRERRAVT